MNNFAFLNFILLSSFMFVFGTNNPDGTNSTLKFVQIVSKKKFLILK